MLTTTEANELLTSILNQFQVALTSASIVQPGEAVTASVFPAVTQINALETLTGAVNAADLTRNLATPPAFQSVPLASAPIAPSTAPAWPEPDNIVSGITGGSAQAGVAQGSASQVLALLNVSVPRIDIKVSWWIRKPLTPGGYADAVEGQDFLAPSGLAAPGVSLLIAPPITELTLESVGATITNLSSPNPSLPLEQWCLYARVTATLGTTTLVRDLGPVPLLVAPLPIPTIVALCNNKDLNVTGGKSKLMFVAPPHTAVSSLEELNDTLQAISSVLGRLRMVAKLAGWVLGVGSLVKLVNKATYAAFYAREFIKHFDDTPLYSRQFWDDIDINDAIESILVIGPPRAEIEFYNEKNLKPGEGILVMRIPITGFVLIRDTHPQFPLGGVRETRPATLPPDPGEQILLGTADGYEEDTDDDGFANSMTGIKFRLAGWPSTALNARTVPCTPPPYPTPTTPKRPTPVPDREAISQRP